MSFLGWVALWVLMVSPEFWPVAGARVVLGVVGELPWLADGRGLTSSVVLLGWSLRLSAFLADPT